MKVNLLTGLSKSAESAKPKSNHYKSKVAPLAWTNDSQENILLMFVLKNYRWASILMKPKSWGESPVGKVPAL